MSDNEKKKIREQAILRWKIMGTASSTKYWTEIHNKKD